MKRHKTAIIGLGNYLLADEGVGLHAIHLLEEKLIGQEVDLIEGHTSGMNLLHMFDERQKIIFIDSGNCGCQPGEFVRFYPHEVVSKKKVENSVSLHDFDLITFLKFAKRIKDLENVEIVIYCMQPGEIKVSQELSPTVKKSLPNLVENVYNEVMKNRNVRVN